jgi:hypothetical protein
MELPAACGALSIVHFGVRLHGRERATLTKAKAAQSRRLPAARSRAKIPADGGACVIIRGQAPKARGAQGAFSFRPEPAVFDAYGHGAAWGVSCPLAASAVAHTQSLPGCHTFRELCGGDNADGS